MTAFKTDYEAAIAVEEALAWLAANGWEVDELREFCEETCDTIEDDE